MTCSPIGFVRCSVNSKALAYRQTQGEVELLPEFRLALSNLEEFERIWLLCWFHRNQGWRSRVLPPGGRVGRKGLFATRSPHRPNPLALTCVPLLGVQGTWVRIGAHDLLNGTPVLDIKPYIPAIDAFPEAGSGWFAQVQSQAPAYQVELTTPVPGELEARIRELLSVDPFPHRTRRIVAVPEGYRLSLGRWRIFYRVEGQRVLVQMACDTQPG